MNSKQALILSILTFITVLAWIGFDVYHTLTSTTIKPVEQEIIKELNPKFDTQTILELRKTTHE